MYVLLPAIVYLCPTPALHQLQPLSLKSLDSFWWVGPCVLVQRSAVVSSHGCIAVGLCVLLVLLRVDCGDWVKIVGVCPTCCGLYG